IGDRATLVQLADAYLLEPALPPPTVIFLAMDLIGSGAVVKGAEVLRKAQQGHPDDFWINHDLGYCLQVQMRPARTNEAIRFYTAAAALRPRSPGAQLNLGNALLNQENLDEAINAFQRAIDLKADYAAAHNNLGIALAKKGQLDDAIVSYNRAV